MSYQRKISSCLENILRSLCLTFLWQRYSVCCDFRGLPLTFTEGQWRWLVTDTRNESQGSGLWQKGTVCSSAGVSFAGRSQPWPCRGPLVSKSVVSSSEEQQAAWKMEKKALGQCWCGVNRCAVWEGRCPAGKSTDPWLRSTSQSHHAGRLSALSESSTATFHIN